MDVWAEGSVVNNRTQHQENAQRQDQIGKPRTICPQVFTSLNSKKNGLEQVCNKRRDALHYTTLFIAMYSLICWIVSGTSLLTSTL